MPTPLLNFDTIQKKIAHLSYFLKSGSLVLSALHSQPFPCALEMVLT